MLVKMPFPKYFLRDSVFGSFITSLIGLIPNCGSSIMITELYLNGAISFGSLIGGLLTGSGVGLFGFVPCQSRYERKRIDFRTCVWPRSILWFYDKFTCNHCLNLFNFKNNWYNEHESQ